MDGKTRNVQLKYLSSSAKQCLSQGYSGRCKPEDKDEDDKEPKDDDEDEDDKNQR